MIIQNKKNIKTRIKSGVGSSWKVIRIQSIHFSIRKKEMRLWITYFIKDHKIISYRFRELVKDQLFVVKTFFLIRNVFSYLRRVFGVAEGF